jgi:hypothetical protein
MALTQWNAFPEERNSVSVCLLDCNRVEPSRFLSYFLLLLAVDIHLSDENGVDRTRSDELGQLRERARNTLDLGGDRRRKLAVEGGALQYHDVRSKSVMFVQGS